MEETKITQVMMDDSTLNVNKEVDMVFSIANTLRGPYKADKYKDIIIPITIRPERSFVLFRVFFLPRDAMMCSAKERKLQYWIWPAAQAGCFPPRTISLSA